MHTGDPRLPASAKAFPAAFAGGAIARHNRAVTLTPDFATKPLKSRTRDRKCPWRGAPCVTIQTFYCGDLGPDDVAGYGRGTTPEDMAGGAVHPWSASVAFHEGLHGMDTTDFLRTRTPPVFGGRAGMTVAQFSDATARWNTEWRAYQALAGAVSHARTDKVGLTTYDDYQRQLPPAVALDGRQDTRPVIYVTPHRPRPGEPG
jgi:hypothetical protein